MSENKDPNEEEVSLPYEPPHSEESEARMKEVLEEACRTQSKILGISNGPGEDSAPDEKPNPSHEKHSDEELLRRSEAIEALQQSKETAMSENNNLTPEEKRLKSSPSNLQHLSDYRKLLEAASRAKEKEGKMSKDGHQDTALTPDEKVLTSKGMTSKDELVPRQQTLESSQKSGVTIGQTSAPVPGKTLGKKPEPELPKPLKASKDSEEPAKKTEEDLEPEKSEQPRARDLPPDLH